MYLHKWSVLNADKTTEMTTHSAVLYQPNTHGQGLMWWNRPDPAVSYIWLTVPAECRPTSHSPCSHKMTIDLLKFLLNISTVSLLSAVLCYWCKSHCRSIYKYIHSDSLTRLVSHEHWNEALTQSMSLNKWFPVVHSFSILKKIFFIFIFNQWWAVTSDSTITISKLGTRFILSADRILVWAFL